ncbi:MAG TPA: universal stress protein [Bryobacteraceae bacterium]|jgi:nucleotide-binding universal stress UspA family protein|nr:universal stress protein [Bryobacteraceae bacterium]
MKVLMATDGSKNASHALTTACRILSPQDREIDLLCVAPVVGAKHHAHRAKLCRRAKRILEAAVAPLRQDGISAKPIVQPGSAARVLVAASLDYDLTVVGAKSHKNRTPAGLGPVASRVVEHANSAVLIGRELHSDAGIKILVPVDGSQGSVLALDTIAAWVDLSAAEITLVHVVETPWLHAGSDQEWIGYEEEKEEEIDAQAQFEREFEREGDEILESARERLPVRTEVNTLIYRGIPAEEILGEAETGDYDLVVMGASGALDLKHQMLGSVSSKVAWNAPCSVLLVRATA